MRKWMQIQNSCQYTLLLLSLKSSSLGKGDKRAPVLTRSAEAGEFIAIEWAGAGHMALLLRDLFELHLGMLHGEWSP